VAFEPRFSSAQVEALLARGDLSRLQSYALQHQHPLNLATHVIGVPLILLSAIWLPLAWVVWGRLDWLPWLGCQVFGWICQGVGHRIEGNKPAFFGDPLQLAIGPWFFLLKLRQLLTGTAPVALPEPVEPS
jgi:uncharacterized membrane protein YGL010W